MAGEFQRVDERVRFGWSLAAVHKSLARHVAEVGTTNLFLLFTLATITFFPLLSVGYTTNDDLMLAIESSEGGLWRSAWAHGVSQGRIGFLWTYPLIQLPYLIDSRVWYLATKYGSFLLLLGALYFAVFQVFRSYWIALGSLVLYLAFIQNGWDHNALTSYPFVFNFLLALFLVSLGVFSIAVDRASLAWAGVAAALFFLSLVTEFFVLYFPLYVAIAVAHAPRGEGIKGRLIATRKYTSTIALTLLAYLAIYLLWRSLFPSVYVGNRPDGWLNLLAASRVVATYSASAFPSESLRFLLSPEAQRKFVDAPGLYSILSNVSSSSIIKAAATGLLLGRLMYAPGFVVPRPRTLLLGAALTFVAIFLPNLLLGATRKYQEWVALSGSASYLYTYHSFLAAAVFAAVALAYVKASSRSWRPAIRNTLAVAGILAAMTTSFAVDVRNQYVAFDQKLSHRRWELMDEVIASPAFLAIEEGATVVAPTLASHSRGIAWAPGPYWTRYVHRKTGRLVQFADDKCAKDLPCYLMVFRQEQHTDNQTIVLAKIRHPESMDGSELTIYSMPSKRGAVVVGSFAAGQPSPSLAIDALPIANVASNDGVGLFSARMPFAPDASRVQVAKVTGNVDFIPQSVIVSHFDSEPRLRSWPAELARGIDLIENRSRAPTFGSSSLEAQGYSDYVVEVSGVSGAEPWGRWTDASVGPAAKFRFRQPLPKRFVLQLTAGAYGPNAGEPVKVRAGNVEQTVVIAAKQDPDTLRLVFDTDGTADSLEIVPPKPTSPHEIDPKNGDTRKLGVSLFAIRIQAVPSQAP